MRKHILTVFLALMMILLCACQDDSEDIAQDSVQSQLPKMPETDIQAEIIAPDIDVKSWYAASVAEYEKFVADYHPPITFIPYNNLADLGEFKNLIFLSDILSDDWSYYQYSFTDQSGFTYNLSIDGRQIQNPEFPEGSAEWMIPDDMRTITKDTNAFLTYNGITYYYINGGLIGMEWSDRGIIYTLFSDPVLLSGYPESDSTVISKLLKSMYSKDDLIRICNLR